MQSVLVRLAKLDWLRRSLLAAIAVALVGTQSFGLYHRIEHGTTAGWVGATQTARPADASLADGLAQGGDAEHHCAAIDALALADGPPAAAIPFYVSPLAATHTLNSEQPNPTVPPLRPFQARAPPVLLS